MLYDLAVPTYSVYLVLGKEEGLLCHPVRSIQTDGQQFHMGRNKDGTLKHAVDRFFLGVCLMVCIVAVM